MDIVSALFYMRRQVKQSKAENSKARKARQRRRCFKKACYSVGIIFRKWTKVDKSRVLFVTGSFPNEFPGDYTFIQFGLSLLNGILGNKIGTFR